MRNTARQTRENRTITVDFQNEATYVQLLGDGKAFVELVLAFILSIGFQLKHKATCRGGGCLTRHSHYVRVRLGGSPSGVSNAPRVVRCSQSSPTLSCAIAECGQTWPVMPCWPRMVASVWNCAR